MPIDGFRYIDGALGRKAQRELMRTIAEGLDAAPLFQPRMPRTGKEFSVRMSNFGRLGWVSDKEGGYRYQATHPDTGLPWPPIPGLLLGLWDDLAACSGPPEACLVNFYRPGARMGSHRDADENEPRAPVLSVSLGCEAVFHVGGLRRSDAKERFVLRSGDVAVLGGPARFAYHGIDRVLAGTSDLIPGGGRINVTLRRVTPFAA
ncbi:MAG: alpha-ketoglutarate-dependent dioxygenase AlkB [Hyphomicrobium sp.]|jgi:alkylated DNA repair protein (DNA oxidative demethylase)